MRMNIGRRGKHAHAASGNIQFPQLASAGASIELLDANGNNAGPLDPAKTTVTWASSNPSVISVSVPDPFDTGRAVLKAPGVAAIGVTITASFANVDGSPSFPDAVSQGIDVPAGPPMEATIVIGDPTLP